MDNGRYEVIVVDAQTGPEDGSVILDLAVATGTHKGEIITVTALGLARDALDLLAVPATLEVTNGEPKVTLEG